MSPRKRPKIGLALGGGAARGWAHLGVLETLAEAGIAADVVCGTSIGALVGAALVADRLPALKHFAETLSRPAMVALVDVKLTAGGLLDGKRVVAMLKKLGIDAAIDSYATPYAAVATDLESGREILLRAGPILDAVRASIAIPGVLSPVRSDGRWLADGGLVNPVPVSACRALGADFVIAVNLNGGLVTPFTPNGLERLGASFIGASNDFIGRMIDQLPERMRESVGGLAPKLLKPRAGTPGYFDVLMNSLNVMQEQITRARLASEPPQVLIEPAVRVIGPFEFDRAAEAIVKGRAAAQEALPEIQRLLG